MAKVLNTKLALVCLIYYAVTVVNQANGQGALGTLIILLY